MNIYLVKRTDTFGVSSFAEFVVVAPDEDTARGTSPLAYDEDDWCVGQLQTGDALDSATNGKAWGSDKHCQWLKISQLDQHLDVSLLGTPTKEKAYWHIAMFNYIEP